VSSAMGVGESFYFYLIQQLSATNTFAYNDTKKQATITLTILEKYTHLVRTDIHFVFFRGF